MKKILIILVLTIFPVIAFSQEEGKPFEADTLTSVPKICTSDSTYANNIAGEFTPGKGFDLVKSDIGSLNVSGYILGRWVDQFPPDAFYTDHLGNLRGVKRRNDIGIHRVFVWFTGFIGDKRLRYNLTVWGLASTMQTLIFGNVNYIFARQFSAGFGIGPNLGIRSMQGSWPFFNASDRQMGEEGMRPGFSGSVWVMGEALPRFYYTASICNNLSQLGVKISDLTRNMTSNISLWWMPTTGEFGPRGGNGDLEDHKKLATRFGGSFVHSRDDKFSSPNDSSTLNTQIRLSDGVYLFEKSALAPGVTVLNGDYNMGSFDMGFKYRGFFLQMQYFFRKYSNFNATGPLPMESIFDQMVMVDVSHMIVPKTLNLYVSGSYMFDDFKRHPSEIALGLNYYPYHTRSVRINGFYSYVHKSPAGGYFGFYSQGMTGPILSLGVDLLL